MNSLNEYFWFSFEWINSLNEYFRRTIEWIIEWIRKVRYSYEKWTKNAFFGRNGPLLPVFHCFLQLWFVFQFEWIILLNEYFWFNFEWIILLNEYSWFNFELNIELNHFLARFNVKMNNQNLSATPSDQGFFDCKKYTFDFMECLEDALTKVDISQGFKIGDKHHKFTMEPPTTSYEPCLRCMLTTESGRPQAQRCRHRPDS